MFDFFQLSGKTPNIIHFWNIIDKDLARELSHNLTILTDISKPWALLMSRFLMLSISLSSQVMEENLAFVLKTTESGI